MKSKIKRYNGTWIVDAVTPNNISIRMWRYKEGWSLFIRHRVDFIYPIIELQYGEYTSEDVRRELPIILEKMDKMIAIAEERK